MHSNLIQSYLCLNVCHYCLSVNLLRSATVHLDGESRLEKMQEIAETVYASLTDAVEELEKDVELNPTRFLGIALYPDKLWSWFITLLTLGLGLA